MPLTLNTTAILLLTAPLILERTSSEANPLTPGEFRRFRGRLQEQSEPLEGLTSSQADQLIQIGCQTDMDTERVRQLLGRGFLLTQVLERWAAMSIWVMCDEDEGYPERYHERLGPNAPPILYGCGDVSILQTGGLAIVGSRNISQQILDYAEDAGRLAARAGCTVISGGAKGVDQAAMRGGLSGGGLVAGVLADSLERSITVAEHRHMIMEQQLVLISPYDPKAGFNVGNAMQRNKLVYALADAGLVVNCDLEKGGTWAGAVEQLPKPGRSTMPYTTIYVRGTGDSLEALKVLQAKGAQPWPEPEDADALLELLRTPLPTPPVMQPCLLEQQSSTVHEPAGKYQAKPAQAEPKADDGLPSPAEQLIATVRSLILAMPGIITIEQAAERLDIPKAQASLWLKRLADDGDLQKTKGGYMRPFRLF